MIKQKPLKLYGQVYDVYLASSLEILELNGLNGEDYYFGLYNKVTSTIYINRELNDYNRCKTLRHELSHVYNDKFKSILFEIEETKCLEEFIVTYLDDSMNDLICLHDIAFSYKFEE